MLDHIFASRALIANDAGPENGITLDAKGAEVIEPPTFVWTGTAADGKATSTACGDWHTKGVTPQGTVGVLGATGSDWTDNKTPRTCSVNLRVLCFER